MIELQNSFTIPASPDEAWRVLLDIERIAPCMPGARLEAVNGDEYEGSVKVKLGAMVITYRGLAKIVQQDEQAHRAVLEASAREARGTGTAKATVVMSLAPVEGASEVTVLTSLHVTGKPAQFGRSVMAEVAARLINQFAERLREELAAGSAPAEDGGASPAAPAAGPDRQDAGGAFPGRPAAPRAQPAGRGTQSRDEPVDLLAVAGLPVAKRAAVAVAVIGASIVLARLLTGSAGAGRRRRVSGITIVCSCHHDRPVP